MRAFAIVDPSHMDRAYAVRDEVFVGEQGVDADAERDYLDTHPQTLHVLVEDDSGQAVATGRLLAPHTDVFHGGDSGHGAMDPAVPHIGRVAVVAWARGTGAGRAVMEFLEAAALERYGVDGAVRVELSAQDQAMPFYARLGYSTHGEGYLDEGIWHHDAFKEVRA